MVINEVGANFFAREVDWLIFNDYDIYKLIEKYSLEDDRVIDAVEGLGFRVQGLGLFCLNSIKRDAVEAKYFITKKDWEGMLELYANWIKNKKNGVYQNGNRKGNRV